MRFDSFSAHWNLLQMRLPHPHFLQTYEWGSVKARYGWQSLYAIWDGRGEMSLIGENSRGFSGEPRAAALVLSRSVTIPVLGSQLRILYVPKGPNLDWSDEPLSGQVLAGLEALARREKAIFLKIDPDVNLGMGVPGGDTDRPDPLGQGVQADLERRGWLFSREQIQFRNTVLLELSGSEEELLGHMKQKTRYNIRLAAKKGVSVRLGKEVDFPLLYRMYAETSVRDGFAIREEAYYQTVWKTFMVSGEPGCTALIAEVGSEPVAALFIFRFAGKAYYVYGMSRESHRDKMPNYLLQWEAMRLARDSGCSVYDLWGAPDEFTETDGLWGVFRFKEGLGGEVVRTLGAWDFAPNRSIYRLYTDVMPRILGIMRSRGKARTQQEIT